MREIIGTSKQNVKTESLDISDNEENNEYKTYEPQVNVEIESLDIIENFQSLLETREDGSETIECKQPAVTNQAKARQCNQCKIVCDTSEKCSEHAFSEHGSGSKHSIEMDSKTERSFSRKLRINKSKNNKVHEGSFPCELCDLTFTLKSNLEKHLRLFHKIPDNKKDKKDVRVRTKLSFICSYCGKSLQTRTNLDWHVRIHTNEKPHECDVCNRMFRTPVTLAAHKLIHTNEKPYSCGICNAAFRQSAHLKTHQLRHQDEKKFSCKICDMSTKFKYNLDTHMRDVHFSAKKNYQCEICQEKMYTKTKLTNHMLTHN